MTGSKPMKIWGALALGTAMILSGCHSTPPSAGTKNADGSITNADGSVTYPAGTAPAQAANQPAQAPAAGTPATAPAAAPAAPAPAPMTAAAPAETPAAAPAPPPAPVASVVPTGAVVRVSLSQTLSAKQNNVGDSFSGVLTGPLHTRGGGSVFKRGTRVAGTVVAAKGQGRFKGAGALGIQLTSIAGIPVQTSEFEQVTQGKGKRTAVLAGGGTGLGAIIGGIAGGGKGALIGGLAGAGAGTAGSAFTGNKDVVIPAESQVTFRLTSPLTVR
ncbi:MULTISPECIES: hypothetical protein [Acidobacteriaceae]|uniref:hypothetical protein n=1 Tax=Acidobacteriaceae TaxID=204434 RepID=UPI00157621B7|nr:MULTISPECIES: hypothetical protein [Acidobacteriaceae]MDW5265119.1 hypothetical protein [Edaphobacter sp.]